MNKTAPSFVLMLLHSVTNTHILHWQTRSFAEHMALGEFYEGLQESVDEFVEAFQGKYGIIENFPTTYEKPKDTPLAQLQSISDNIAVMRKGLPEDSELQNLIDEIAGLVDTTMYKLRFLK